MAAPKRTLWTSTIGLKVVMAASGLGLVGFVLFHMLGHLQVLSGGRDAYNAYAHFMYGLGGFLWLARAGLFGLLAVHVASAVALKQRNDAARPHAYVVQTHRASTPFARWMFFSGVGVLAFVGYHLAHFTIGVAHPEHFAALDAEGRRDVYGNFVYSFQNPLVFGLYAIAMSLLAIHLAHACTSVFRTLGLMHGRFRPRWRRSAPRSRSWPPSDSSSLRSPASCASSRPDLMDLDARIPAGRIDQKWDNHRFELELVNPANKRKYTIIVVGSGLAGASAAASLAELGYDVLCFCIQDSPRRAHSIAAQGGINAAKNYQNDGDSVYRLFYDTVKGGDFRAREANVYRLSQVSVSPKEISLDAITTLNRELTRATLLTRE